MYSDPQLVKREFEKSIPLLFKPCPKKIFSHPILRSEVKVLYASKYISVLPLEISGLLKITNGLNLASEEVKSKIVMTNKINIDVNKIFFLDFLEIFH